MKPRKLRSINIDFPSLCAAYERAPQFEFVFQRDQTEIKVNAVEFLYSEKRPF